MNIKLRFQGWSSKDMSDYLRFAIDFSGQRNENEV
jgi:hypothetical protein